MDIKAKPVTITLTPDEMHALVGVFDIFRNTMSIVEVDVPIEIRTSMASILGKIVDRMLEQVVEKAMKN